MLLFVADMWQYYQETDKGSLTGGCTAGMGNFNDGEGHNFSSSLPEGRIGPRTSTNRYEKATILNKTKICVYTCLYVY